MVRPAIADDPAPLKLTVVAVVGAAGEESKAAVGVSLPTLSVTVAGMLVRPASSVTTSVTVYVPALGKSWVVCGVDVVFESPSPKSHAYVRIVRPAAARLADALKFTTCNGSGAAGEVVNDAVGFTPGATFTVLDSDLERPTESEIVSVTT